jgi:hypothetical protein
MCLYLDHGGLGVAGALEALPELRIHRALVIPMGDGDGDGDDDGGVHRALVIPMRVAKHQQRFK